jgi:protein-arginine kinase activator protein McsA
VANRHVGKSPRHGRQDPQRMAELLDLRQQLRAAVDAEAYEEAARLRDLIRQKESHG